MTAIPVGAEEPEQRASGADMTLSKPSVTSGAPLASARVTDALSLYRAIFDRSTEAIAVLDASGRYVEQNDVHHRLVGYSTADLRGQTPALHLGAEQFASIVEELQSTGVCRRECVSRGRSGIARLIDLSAFAVRDDRGDVVCYVGIKRDITDQKRSAAELQRSFDELQAVYRMVETVARAGALDDIYATALQELQQTVKADRASILLFDADGVMRFKAWQGLSDEYRQAVEGHTPWSADDVDPQPVLVPDVFADAGLAPYAALFRQEGIGALAFIPLVDAGRLLGKFMVYFDAPTRFETVAVRLAQTIASHIAFAISRKRSDTALRRSEQRNRLLADAGALLNSSLEYEETLQSITQLAVPAVADWCLVDEVDATGVIERIAAVSSSEVDAAVAAGMRRQFAALPNTGHGVTHVVESGKPELVAHVTDDLLQLLARDAEHLQLLRAMRMTSYVCIPLVTRGRTIGAVTFAVGPSGRTYSMEDVPLAEELARRAALAIDNARLYREAQEANRAKSQFLATMSHELRTPLNAIGGYTELLQLGLRGPLTELQHADLTRIQRSQQHLLGLINDLLNFARIESGHIELHLETLVVQDAIEGVQSLVTPQLEAKDITLVEQPGETGVTCHADRDKLRQVLLNLLTNAVKFTPKGGTITLACERSGKHVHLRVTDTGPGIPGDKLESIFEPFVQLASAPTPVAEGAGLGLAISRELARAMGGDVTVRNHAGGGATFVCTLPIAPAHAVIPAS